MWPLHHTVCHHPRGYNTLNHSSTAQEMSSFYTQLCCRTACSCLSFRSRPLTKHSNMRGLRHIDICGLSTTPCAIILGVKTPLTIPPRLKKCHLSIHNYAAARLVPACPFALDPDPRTLISRG